MKHADYVKAAKDLNAKAGTTIKVIAVKGDVLKKAIQTTVAGLTGFNFSTLEDATLDVFDELKCEYPEEMEVESEVLGEDIEEDFIDEEDGEPEMEVEVEGQDFITEGVQEGDIAMNTETGEETAEAPKDNVIPMKKEDRTVWQQGPALIAAATDIADVLGYDKGAIARFKKLGLKEMTKELQAMAAEINVPYEQDGKTIQPEDKPEDFKPETIKCLDANKIKVKWGEGDKGFTIEKAVSDKVKPAKGKKIKPAAEKPAKVDKPKKEKNEKSPINMPMLKELTLTVLKKSKTALSVKDINEKMKAISKLSDEILAEMHCDTKYTVFEYRAAWARTYLKKDGLINSPGRSMWQIS